MITGFPPKVAEITEFVVPKSIPIDELYFEGNEGSVGLCTITPAGVISAVNRVK